MEQRAESGVYSGYSESRMSSTKLNDMEQRAESGVYSGYFESRMS